QRHISDEREREMAGEELRRKKDGRDCQVRPSSGSEIALGAPQKRGQIGPTNDCPFPIDARWEPSVRVDQRREEGAELAGAKLAREPPHQPERSDIMNQMIETVRDPEVKEAVQEQRRRVEHAGLTLRYGGVPESSSIVP